MTSPTDDLARLCEHYACRCARAAELAAMDNGSGRMTMLALEVHAQRVPCRATHVKGKADE